MARKDTLKYPILTSQSLATSFNSPVTFIRHADNVSYQISITTTNSTGSFTVQVSNDYAVDPSGTVTNTGTWTNLTLGGGSPTVNAANDTIAISLNQLPFDAVRLAYTSSVAGTGTCSATIVTKQIGG